MEMDDRDILNLLIGNLRYLMAEKGLNAVTLAEKAGLNRNAIYDILKGKSGSPRLHTMHAIADALGVSVGQLLIPRSGEKVKAALTAQIDEMDREQVEKLLQISAIILGLPQTGEEPGDN